MKIVGLLILLSLYFNWAWGQVDSIAVCLEKIKNNPEDSLRLEYADQIPGYLEKIKYGEYPTLPAVKFLGYKKCTNDEAELFSWAVPLKEGQALYNWFRFEEGNKSCLLKSLPGEENGAPAWLFYDWVAFESGKQKYYALLGWNKTRSTNQKIVQMARFDSRGKVSFKHPLMRRGNSRSASLSFEYALDGSMMLQPDKKGKRIIFDHLAPAEKKYEGYFMFYGADASYDALLLKNGEWWYHEDVKGY